MSKSKLRRVAGRIKFRVLDCWPYKFKAIRARKLRAQFAKKAFELPRIPAPAEPEVEIHMMCGKGQLDMGVWASWSILRFLENAVLYVHSDGTLEETDMDSWGRVIKGLVFVSKAEADVRAQEKLSRRWPLTYEWRCSYDYSVQVVDVHLFGQTDRLIVMDSDVLCFKDPVELRGWVSGNEATYRWHKDVRTCYFADIELLNEITGLSLPEAFTAGFLLTPRFSEQQFHYLEKAINTLKSDGRVDVCGLWAAQTLDAIIAAMDPHPKEPLPSSYTVALGRTTDDMIIRHYPGVPKARPRYFTEGIPKLLRDLLGKH